ncbi:MAG TPA: Stk1 family PASTA domain-containing Ser/Thr kinase [Candidatus Limnocylindrales bacterium]|nr:Stk1 family PASTA domain-containing Ser/Thr kinase [Candidatus Limnocylindrales bacterium]
MPDIGRLLGGRYRLVELLGEGGMATVYRAHDDRLSRDVAVKLLRPEYGRDAAFVARFRQEAQSAASLSHPNIVRVFDFGTDEAGPYIVMELVEGQDLGEVLAERGALAPAAAARIALQVAEGLAAAHAHGIIHRDIKPGNIRLDRRGRALLLDFGIARAFSEAQLTLPGTTLGSVHYFSPEQARGETVTASSDLYSLGLVLFEMLTGQRPFGGDSAAAVAVARLSAEPPVPSSRRGGIPPALDAIVRKALAREPAQRFASAAALAQTLERFLTDPSAVPAAAAAPRPAPLIDPNPTVIGAAVGPARGTAAGRPGTVPPRAGRTVALEEEEDAAGPWGWVAAIIGLLILAVAGALVFLVLSDRGPGTSPSPSVEMVAVPDLVDLPLAEAQRVATAAGFRLVQAGSEEHDDRPENTVVKQEPGPPGPAARGSEIRVTVSTRKATVAVPDLRGRTEAEAVQLLLAAELVPGTRTEAFDPDIRAGRVVSSEPPALQEVPRGSSVAYVVSKGPQPTPSPSPTPPPTAQPTPELVRVGDYRCKTLAEATAAIEGDRLSVGEVTPPSPPAEWVVVAQDPRRGRNVPVGTAVDLTLVARDDPQAIVVCGAPPPTP